MIDKKIASEVISVVLEEGADFAELFIEDKYSTNVNMVNGDIDNALSGKNFGVGIRAFKENLGVYGYTNDVTKDTLLKVAKKVGKATNATGREQRNLDFTDQELENKHYFRISPEEVGSKEISRLMEEAHNGANSYSETITQVMVRFLSYDQKVWIYNSEGLSTYDRRVRTRLIIMAVATKDGVKETGFYGPGAGMGFEFFDIVNPYDAGVRAGRIASRMVEADYAPAGKMPVIIANEFGGVIFHEACGHSLEATSVAKGSSVFAGKLGEKIAADCVSAVDDGTIPNAWGSANIDDEGNLTRRNLLIDKGILKGYLVDKLNGRRLQMKPTGSSRRQSYKYAPTSRMSNTFILSGNYYPEEIISNTEYGLYARSMGGGSVVPATGEFNFSIREGYLIKNGRIHKPVRGATLVGKGSEIIKKIDMVGNDLERGQGMCGSASGMIPADVGQPTLRVSELTVGGRNE
ncbi:MAG: TldD/PmbA family protein [Petrotogales bacterium]